MKKYTLDRFEGDYAILLLRPDETEHVDVLARLLPSNVKEGDILQVEFGDNGEVVRAEVLDDETASAKKRVESLIQKLVDKNK